MNAVPPTTTGRARLTGRVQFVLLALLFFAPFAAAWMLYFYFPNSRPSGTTNYGELVTPPRELPEWTWVGADGQAVGSRSLQGKWLLIQLVEGDCDTACVDRLMLTRQTRTAMAADRERVQRVVLGDEAAGVPALRERHQAEQPDAQWFGSADLAAVRAFFGSQDAEALFLVDPAGNYLMVYPGGKGTQADFKGIQKDLRKLLKLSRLG